jgi:membrane-associated phospholipid phosphatase
VVVIGWGLAIVAALLLTFVFARYVSKRIPHGEARFDENGKLIEDE